MQLWLMLKTPTLDLMDVLLRTLFISLFHSPKASRINVLLSFIHTFQQVPDGSRTDPSEKRRQEKGDTNTVPTRTFCYKLAI